MKTLSVTHSLKSWVTLSCTGIKTAPIFLYFLEMQSHYIVFNLIQRRKRLSILFTGIEHIWREYHSASYLLVCIFFTKETTLIRTYKCSSPPGARCLSSPHTIVKPVRLDNDTESKGRVNYWSTVPLDVRSERRPPLDGALEATIQSNEKLHKITDLAAQILFAWE